MAKKLRETAEASATQRQLNIPKLSAEDTHRLVHELQVHQIELEIQNEELRRIMSELEQSRNLFSLLFHRAPVGYLALDEIGLIHEVNETFCRMTNTHRSQLVNSPFAEYMGDDDRHIFLARYRALFKNPADKSLEVSILRAKGTTFYAQIEGTSFNASLTGHQETNRPLLLLSVTDITARKHAEDKRIALERQMQQTQKLESLGVLAGGIAHDFNNFLTSILGNASLALDKLPHSSPVHDSLHAIEKSSLRAAELCRQMLAYSGKNQLIVENIQINNLIEEMIALFKVSISKKASLSLHLNNSIPPMRGDPGQIRQIIMNLVINASEAIGEQNGIIAISTGVMSCTHDYLAASYLNSNLNEGLYIWLEVSDTGLGMNAETLRRLFEPFFTTKFTGRGLGLSAVLGIVRGHQGTLWVHSEPSKGTTFKVLFPAIEGNEAPAPKIRFKQDKWHGNGTVLLVDDEEPVRELGTRMLERIGFQVLVAANGREALDLYKARHDEIMLVFLDLTMPCMDGEEAFHHLRKINPKVRVLLTSGYSEADIAQHFTGKPFFGFLQKPYSLETLTRCVHDALERSQ